MSLINEALKKAQRLQHEKQAATTTSGDTPAGQVRPRRQPMGAQALLVVIAGGSALIVLSVVITVILLNREPEPAPRPAAPAAVVKTTPSIDANAPSPVIVAPVIPRPAPSAEPAPPPETPVAAAPPPKEPATAPAVAATVPSPAPAHEPSASPPAPTAPVVAPAVKPDPQIQRFVDDIRVTGIRSSGTESKVLMNDRVYRVNDIVDRTLGVRLVKVAPDTLTFADANGVTYEKTF